MNWNNFINALNFDNVDQEEILYNATRRSFFKSAKNVSLKTALMSLPLAATLMPHVVKAQSTAEITDALNFALTLEYLEDEFYKTALDTAGLIPEADRAIFTQIGKHETAHVAFLKTALGFAAVQMPEFDFTAKGAYPNVFSDYPTFLALSQSFEDTGVRAYKGQAATLRTNDGVLTSALRIHSVEARHAAEVRWLRAEVTSQSIKPWIEFNESNGAPQPIYAGEENTTQNGVKLAELTAINSLSLGAKTASFDEPLTKDQVLAIVNPFIAS